MKPNCETANVTKADSCASEFHRSLRAEIIQSQNRRSEFVKYKFTFVIGALGLGSLAMPGHISTSPLLFCVPVIALAYDLYILGEDFGIKRAGAFLARSRSKASDEEKAWEKLVAENRDHFSVVAGPILSLLATTGAGLMYFTLKSDAIEISPNALNTTKEVHLAIPIGNNWFVVIGTFIFMLTAYALWRIRRVREAAKKI